MELLRQRSIGSLEWTPIVNTEHAYVYVIVEGLSDITWQKQIGSIRYSAQKDQNHTHL